VTQLPTGTVTFLFTDIEGSTALVKRLGQRYGEVLAEHQRLLRYAFESLGGNEVDTQGDAFFFAFARAKDAVAAAVDGQRALASQEWPDNVPVRVRVGIHSGEAAVAGGRYVGLGVHRAARICAAASGGQILLSASTYGLLADDPLPDLELRDLGERALKDLDRSERLYEAVPSGEAIQRRGPLRVVVADDSVLLREGLARLLDESGFDVVGQAGDAEDLLRKVGAHKPDVAVVDVRMPPTHTDEGLRAAHRIRAEHPGTGVLVLSQYVDEAYAMELLSESTESTGYLLKDRVADVDTFTDAVRRVAGGGSALDPEVVALLLGRRRREDPLEALTAREREVLALMAEGRSNAAIAEALVVTERAVEKHVTSIFSKLDLTPTVEDHRRVLAVLAYLRAGD
jgi:DNA-binding NarL/FixJ family response regulator/class 3 adenylate cyclase